MRVVKDEIFGKIYDKIYERVIERNGSFSGFEIEPEESVKTYLEELWELGKKWESITLLITYHYTRKDDLILGLSGKLISFSKLSFLPDILKSLSLRYVSLNDIVIGEEEYRELRDNIDKILPQMPSKDKITTFLGKMSIRNSESKYFEKVRKTLNRKKFIKLLILYKKTRLGNVITDDGSYKKGIELQELLETINKKIDD
jgi:hypothetical protein